MIKSAFHYRRTFQRISQGSSLVIRREAAMRPAFTLVEMLISTALVMMIMTMFAQIYGTAVNTMSMQRGMANNDQKARTVNNLILADLSARTYHQTTYPYGSAKGLVPLVRETNQLIDADQQRGYFYYSENNPADDTDDVLQFTAKIRESNLDLENRLTEKFQGKSVNLGSALVQQPELDDGDRDNSASESKAAEISYFLRGGNLYRRVLLLRDPRQGSGPEAVQPQDNAGNRLFGVGADYSTPFWRDFDFSATREYDATAATPGSYLWFNSLFSLENATAGPDYKPLALPWNRFGHHNNKADGNTNGFPDDLNHGCPREVLLSGPPERRHIGRFTSEETSHNDMGWPGQAIGQFNRADTIHELNSDFTILRLSGGSRISEDLLLTNVEAFNVEYWDDTNEKFLSLGSPESGTSGWRDSNVKNSRYGPHMPSGSEPNRVFDTWHQDAFVVVDDATTAPIINTLPPRFPLIYEGITNNWTDLPAPPATIPVGTIIRAPGHNQSTFVLKAIQAGERLPDATPPTFNLTPDALTDEGTGLVWQCLDNRIGMKAIRITIRFRDVGKNLPRQLTLVHSFVE